MLHKMSQLKLTEIKTYEMQNCPTCKVRMSVICDTCDKVVSFYRRALEAEIPHQYLFMRMSDLKVDYVQPAKQQVQAFLDDLERHSTSGKVLFLHGKKIPKAGEHKENGTGKTSLACISLKKGISIGLTGHFFSFGAVVDDPTKNRAELENIKHAISNAQLLVIDGLSDLRATAKGDTSRDILLEILQKRSNVGLVTILTTSLNLPVFLKAYGKEVESFLYEHGVFVECSGADYRKAHTLGGTN